MLNKFGISAFLVLASSAVGQAGTCPAGAPEGYKWLSGYVEEFQSKGTISSWFTDSLSKNPNDYALLALQAYFDTEGRVADARALHIERGGRGGEFDAAMSCAGVS